MPDGPLQKLLHYNLDYPTIRPWSSLAGVEYGGATDLQLTGFGSSVLSYRSTRAKSKKKSSKLPHLRTISPGSM